jgi:hypothetical protein
MHFHLGRRSEMVELYLHILHVFMAWCLINEVQRHFCLFNLTLSDNIHRPIFIQNDVSETGLYLRPETKEPTQLLLDLGRAIAQAVSRRLATSGVRVRAQIRSYGICGGQSGIGASFFRALLFSLPILISPTAPHSSSTSGAGTIGE